MKGETDGGRLPRRWVTSGGSERSKAFQQDVTPMPHEPEKESEEEAQIDERLDRIIDFLATYLP